MVEVEAGLGVFLLPGEAVFGEVLAALICVSLAEGAVGESLDLAARAVREDVQAVEVGGRREQEDALNTRRASPITCSICHRISSRISRTAPAARGP